MLTDAECKNATCPLEKTRARLACSGGLYLEVSPAGSKTRHLNKSSTRVLKYLGR